MVVFELKKGFPKNCEECPLFINKSAGYSAFCIGEAKYTTEEIEAEKDGNLTMFYHGCLSNRPKSCPLKEILEEPSIIELSRELIRCEYWDTESNYCALYRPAAESSNKLFEEIVVEYPDPDTCPYQEYKGKPYFLIRYLEDG